MNRLPHSSPNLPLLLLAVIVVSGTAYGQDAASSSPRTLFSQGSKIAVESAATEFLGKGPAGFKIKGTTSELRLAVDGDQLVVTIPLAKMDTGIALRNRHMSEKYLEVEKYPDAVLRVPVSAIQLPAEGASTSGSPAGQMSIHGKTKSVPFSYQASRQGNTYSVTGSLNLNFNDFGIELPTYLGVTLKPDIVLNTKFVAKGG